MDVRWLYKIFTGVLVAFGSVLVLFLVLEISVRVYSTLFFARMMGLDDRLGWRHEKNVSKTFRNEDLEYVAVKQNGHGHRGRDHGSVKATGKSRILILGDSFTEGVHVKEDELFSSRLEAMNPDLEAMNAGVGGYGTVQEYLYLVREGLAFDPDLVLLMFYENDLSDNCLSYYPGFGPRPYAVWKNGAMQIVEQLDYKEFKKFIIPVPLWEYLNRHSYLYYFINVSIYQKLFADKMRNLQKLDLEKTRECGKYGIFFGIIQKMRSLLTAERVQFGVVLIPTREDVERGSSPTQQPILSFCRASGIKCHALLDRFITERSAGQRLYFTNDIHWTRRGHETAADEIGEFVKALSVVSARDKRPWPDGGK